MLHHIRKVLCPNLQTQFLRKKPKTRSLIENERFGLVFAKTGSLNSRTILLIVSRSDGTKHYIRSINNVSRTELETNKKLAQGETGTQKPRGMDSQPHQKPKHRNPAAWTVPGIHLV
jgi:hypothetical protein